MSELPVVAMGELRPDWLIAVRGAIKQARDAGWTLRGDITFEGNPYVWNGEPRMSRWTVTEEQYEESLTDDE